MMYGAYNVKKYGLSLHKTQNTSANGTPQLDQSAVTKQTFRNYFYHKKSNRRKHGASLPYEILR